MRGKSFIEFEGTRKQEGQAPPTCYSDLLSSLNLYFIPFLRNTSLRFSFLFVLQWILDPIFLCIFLFILFFRRIPTETYIVGEGKRNRHHFVVSSHFLSILGNVPLFLFFIFSFGVVFNQLIFMSFIC